MGERLARHQEVDRGCRPVAQRRHPAHPAAALDGAHLARAGHRQAGGGEHLVPTGADQGEHRPRVGHQRRLDAEQEDHALQPAQQRGAGTGLDIGPDGAVELGEHQVVLDVAVRREQQRLRAAAVGQPLEVLAGQVVQPGEPVGTGDGEDVAVAAVDQAGALGEHALLAQRIAVVRGDRGGRGAGLDGDGAGQGQQR